MTLNAAPLEQRKRLIVVPYSAGGSDLADHALAATLARARFVVAQPLHAGDHWQHSRQTGPSGV